MVSETEANREDPGEKLEALLDFLRDDRGFDFTGYKRASLERRIQRRMLEVAIESYSEYMDYLQFHPDEFTALFNTILINVTSFLRDRESWEALRDRILPELLADSRPSQPIRVWSAGVANGSEAYSVALLLAEAMGVAEFRDRVKIYATDVDEDALAEARAGLYREAQVQSVPPEYLDRWFVRQPAGYAIDRDLRRAVIFGRNDLVRDAPISRVDVLVCRNTLIYFNAETQDRVLGRFHFALKDSGVLFLGKAETLLTRSELFVPIEARHRLFRRVPGDSAVGFGKPISRAGARALDTARDESAIARAFDAHDQAFLIVSREGILVLGNQRALDLFGLGPGHLGQPFRELDVSVRPLDLRPVLDRVAREHREVTVEDVEWVADQTSYWRITVRPLAGDSDILPAGWVVLFSDVTTTHQLQSDLSYANRQLETAYEELQSTVEELETTNEELQSTIEELETTNEELQSTNEELETTNEELRSTNDGLQLVNDELSERNVQVAAVNSFLDSVLGNFDGAVIVVDRHFHVTAWSGPAEDMWGLRAEEVIGQHLMNLDIGLPMDTLYPLARKVLAGAESLAHESVDAVNRRGRSIVASTTLTPLTSAAGDAEGVVFLITDASNEAS